MRNLKRKTWLGHHCIFAFLLGLLSVEINFLQAGEVINPNKPLVQYQGNLQAAINDANPGDTLELKGKFTGQFTINKSLNLIGNGKANTILDGKNGGDGTVPVSVLSIIGQAVGEIPITRVSVQDLTIQNGKAPKGGGIFNMSTDLTLNRVKITENRARLDHAEGRGGGIASEQGFVTINNSEITHNSAFIEGGGIYITGGFLVMDNSNVNRNKVTLGRGGGVKITSTILGNRISRSNIQHNKCESLTGCGGGLTNENNSATILINCEFIANEALCGGGAYNNAQLSITSSLFKENKAIIQFRGEGVSGKGGGLFNDQNGKAFFADSKVNDNTANPQGNNIGRKGEGGGIFNAAARENVSLINTTVKNNKPNNVVNVNLPD